MDIKTASTAKEIEDCFDVMSELRPHLLREEFVAQVREQEQQGYLLAFIEDESGVACVVGFRISKCLSWGKFYMWMIWSRQKLVDQRATEKPC